MPARADERNGDFYEILAPAAAKLEAKHPLAATILCRALIDCALERNRTKRYQHAARHLEECETLADRIEDFGRFETHDAYMKRLKAHHGRKSSFRSLVACEWHHGLFCAGDSRACERNAQLMTKAAV